MPEAKRRGSFAPRTGAAVGMAVMLLLWGCIRAPSINGPTSSHGGPIRDHVSFVDHLRARAVTVDIGDAVSEPFLHSYVGTRLYLGAVDLSSPVTVLSFDYRSSADAAKDVAQVMRNQNAVFAALGSVATSHLYHKDRLIAIYVGADRSAIRMLKSVLGDQFAGG